MAQKKASHNKQSRKTSKQPIWLVFVVFGVLILIGGAAIALLRDNNNSIGRTSEPANGQRRFTENFTPRVEGAPRVEVPEDYIDYGDVKLGDFVQTVFNVRNVGDQPLTIYGEPRVELVEGC